MTERLTRFDRRWLWICGILVLIVYLIGGSVYAQTADTNRIAFIVQDPAALVNDTILGNYIEDSLTNADITYIVTYVDEGTGAIPVDTLDAIIVSYGNTGITSAEIAWLLDSTVNVFAYNQNVRTALMMGGNFIQSASTLQEMKRYDTLWPNQNRNGGDDSIAVFSDRLTSISIDGVRGVGGLKVLYYQYANALGATGASGSDTALVVAVDSGGLLDDATTPAKGRYLYDGTIAFEHCTNCDDLGESQLDRILNEILWVAGDTTHTWTTKVVFEGYQLTAYWAEYGNTGKHELYGGGNPATTSPSMRVGYDGNQHDTSYFMGEGFWYVHDVDKFLAGRSVDSGWGKLPIDHFADDDDAEYTYNFPITFHLITHTYGPFTIQPISLPVGTIMQTDTTYLTSINGLNRYAFKGWDTLWGGPENPDATLSRPLAGTDYTTASFDSIVVDSATYGHYESSTGVDTLYAPEIVFTIPDSVWQDWKSVNKGFYSRTDTSYTDITTCGCGMEIIGSATKSVSGVTVNQVCISCTATAGDFATRVVVWTSDSTATVTPQPSATPRLRGLR